MAMSTPNVKPPAMATGNSKAISGAHSVPAPPAPVGSPASLSFRATGRDRSGSALGVLVDASGAQQHLAIAADGSCTLTGALPPGQKPVLLYESAANVLRGGAPNPDGTISYQGDSYRIQSTFDGKSWTAKLSSVVS